MPKLRAPSFLIACCAALACLGLPTAAAYGLSAGPGAAASAAKSAAAPARPGSLPTADVIESAASAAGLANVYGGDIVNRGGAVTIYVTPGGKARMSSALVKAVGPANSKAYTFKVVPHSFASLEALTLRLANERASLKRSGIDPVWIGPDASSSTVLVKVISDKPAAAATLRSRFGASWLTVQPFTGHLPIRTSNRYYDNSPFYNGDRVWFNNSPNGSKCTDAFAWTGNRSGTVFNTTAGHCGGSSIWTNFTSHFKMGNVSTNYFNTTNGNYDLESFACGCGSPVWYEGPSIGTASGYTHNLIGQCVCGVGQYVTADGATTGESTGNYVQDVGICVTFSDGIQTCHLNYAYNPSGHNMCQPGDSGGPVYQRTSNVANVLATGLIVGTDNNTDCYYHDIADVLKLVNGTLIHN